MRKVVDFLFYESIQVLLFLIFFFPGKLMCYFRGLLLKTFFNKCGNRLLLDRNLNIKGFKNITLGNGCNIQYDCALIAYNNGNIEIGDNLNMNYNACLNAADGGKILIGNNVLIAQNVVIRASNHNFDNLFQLINSQGHKAGEIVIGDDCWIGANVVIVPGVIIGEKSVIGAGSVVTKNIPAFSVVGGVPAKVIKKRT